MEHAGLLRLSSLYNLADSVGAFCARVWQAGRTTFHEQDCIFIRRQVLEASHKWARWRWHAVTDQATLHSFTVELSERLARFQAEAFATMRFHAPLA